MLEKLGINFQLKFANPRNERTPLTDEGGCQSLMADSLVGSMHTRPCPIIMPRYSMMGVSKEHLEILRESLCS